MSGASPSKRSGLTEVLNWIVAGQARSNWIRGSETLPRFVNDITANSTWLGLTDLHRAKTALPDTRERFSHLIFDNLVVYPSRDADIELHLEVANFRYIMRQIIPSVSSSIFTSTCEQ